MILLWKGGECATKKGALRACNGGERRGSLDALCGRAREMYARESRCRGCSAARRASANDRTRACSPRGEIAWEIEPEQVKRLASPSPPYKVAWSVVVSSANPPRKFARPARTTLPGLSSVDEERRRPSADTALNARRGAGIGKDDNELFCIIRGLEGNAKPPAAGRHAPVSAVGVQL